MHGDFVGMPLVGIQYLSGYPQGASLQITTNLFYVITFKSPRADMSRSEINLSLLQKANMPNLFSEFAPATKQDWLNKIEKELKGRPFEDLQWQLGEFGIVEPFYVAEDVAKTTPIRMPLFCKIGEDILVENAKTANENLLEGLLNGVNAPGIHFIRNPQMKTWEKVFEGVEADWIETHFYWKNASWKDWQSILSEFQEYNSSKNKPLAEINGAIHFEPGNEDFSTLAADLKHWESVFPFFKFITVSGKTNWQGKEHVVDELRATIQQGIEVLDKLTDEGLDAKTIADNLQFSVYVGTSYFIEIAKLRALHLLWANVLKAYNVEVDTVKIDVEFAPQTQDENPNTNLIKATTMAMAAHIGGAARLTVLPSKDNAFGRRIARNVQHLLQMESHFGKVNDPSAGSYYIEVLTRRMVEQVWERLV